MGKYKIDVMDKDKLKYRLLKKCMQIKHALTVEKEAALDLNDYDGNIDGALSVTRQEFERQATELLNKIRNVIIEALSRTNYTSSDINKVLLAGGSSRMPMIKLLLLNLFSNAEIACHENPDEVVAIGAAYYAYYLQQQSLQEKQATSKINSPIINEKIVTQQKKKECLVM